MTVYSGTHPVFVSHTKELEQMLYFLADLQHRLQQKGKDSGEKYDCLILGLQRHNLPILQPDINMTIQPDDYIWILGSRRMAEKLLAGGFDTDEDDPQ